MEEIGDRPLAAACCFNLGHGYNEVLDDLDRTEAWYLRALERIDAGNRRMQAAVHGSLGNVALLRARRIFDRRGPLPVRRKHLEEARRRCEQSLAMLAEGAPADLGVIHNTLGQICNQLEDFEAAFRHYGEAIRHALACGNIFWVGGARLNTARMLYLKALVLEWPKEVVEAAVAFARSAADDLCPIQERIAQELCQEARQLAAELKEKLRELRSS